MITDNYNSPKLIIHQKKYTKVYPQWFRTFLQQTKRHFGTFSNWLPILVPPWKPFSLGRFTDSTHGRYIRLTWHPRKSFLLKGESRRAAKMMHVESICWRMRHIVFCGFCWKNEVFCSYHLYILYYLYTFIYIYVYLYTHDPFVNHHISINFQDASNY